MAVTTSVSIFASQTAGSGAEKVEPLTQAEI
jgi:hypothetical protein